MVSLRAIDASDVLITVGELSRTIAQEALSNGMAQDRVKMCATNDEATAYLNAIVQPGDMILIKARADCIWKTS